MAQFFGYFDTVMSLQFIKLDAVRVQILLSLQQCLVTLNQLFQDLVLYKTSKKYESKIFYSIVESTIYSVPLIVGSTLNTKDLVSTKTKYTSKSCVMKIFINERLFLNLALNKILIRFINIIQQIFISTFNIKITTMELLLCIYLLIVYATSSDYLKYDPTNNGQFRVIEAFQSQKQMEVFFQLEDQNGITYLKRIMYNSSAQEKYIEVSLKLKASQNFRVVSRSKFSCVLIDDKPVHGPHYIYFRKIDPFASTLLNPTLNATFLMSLLNAEQLTNVDLSTNCQCFKYDSYYGRYILGVGWVSNNRSQLYNDDFQYRVSFWGDIIQFSVYDRLSNVYNIVTAMQSNSYILHAKDDQSLGIGNQVLVQCGQRTCLILKFTQNSTIQMLFILFVYQKSRMYNGGWTRQIYTDKYLGQIYFRFSPKVSNVLLQYRSLTDSPIKTLGLGLNRKPASQFKQYPELISPKQGFNTVALSDNYLLFFGEFSDYPDKLTQKIFKINGEYLQQLILWDSAYNTGFTKIFIIQEDSYERHSTVLHYYVLGDYRIVSSTEFIADALTLSKGLKIQVNNGPQNEIQQSKAQIKTSLFNVIVVSVSVPTSAIFLITILVILRKKKIIKLPKWVRKLLRKSKKQHQENKQKIQNSINGPYEWIFGMASTDVALSWRQKGVQSIKQAKQQVQQKKMKNHRDQIMPMKKVRNKKKRTQRMTPYLIT